MMYETQTHFILDISSRQTSKKTRKTNSSTQKIIFFRSDRHGCRKHLSVNFKHTTFASSQRDVIIIKTIFVFFSSWLSAWPNVNLTDNAPISLLFCSLCLAPHARIFTTLSKKIDAHTPEIEIFTKTHHEPFLSSNSFQKPATYYHAKNKLLSQNQGSGYLRYYRQYLVSDFFKHSIFLQL